MDAVAYLRDRVLRDYLEVLPSRWSAVLPRLAKRTQTLQRNDTVVDASLMTDFHTDCDLLDALLDEEHTIYHEGLRCMGHTADGEIIFSRESGKRSASESLLRGMLTSIAMKEMILAHWRESPLEISPDTLRVYCHACIAHPHIRTEDAERVLAVHTAR